MKRILLLTIIIIVTTAFSGIAQFSNNYILYSRIDSPNGSIWIKNDQGVDSMLFLNGYGPRISANGSHFLYMRNTAISNWDRDGQFMRYDMLTRYDTPIYNNTDYITEYDFLNDDSTIVVSSECGIYVDEFNGQYTGHELSGSNCYDDAPDVRQRDSLVVWHNITASMFTEKALSGSPTPVLHTDGKDVFPVWSADGNWILFSRINTSLTLANRYVNFYKIKLNGDSLTQLTFNDTTKGGPYTAPAVWINNGKQLLTAGFFNGTTYNFIIINTDGSGTAYKLSTVAGDTINFIGTTPASQFTFSTGLMEAGKKSGPVIYPNPVTGLLIIRQPDINIQQIDVFDVLGKNVYSVPSVKASAEHTVTIDFSRFVQGIYFVNTTDEKGNRVTEKIIKM